MNVIDRQTTVISMPLVEMNVGHIHASVRMVQLGMASNAGMTYTLPVLRSEQMAVV